MNGGDLVLTYFLVVGIAFHVYALFFLFLRYQLRKQDREVEAFRSQIAEVQTLYADGDNLYPEPPPPRKQG